MSKIEELKEKYWLEFIIDTKGDSSTWKSVEMHFWFWFYNEKVKAEVRQQFEDYL